MIIVGAIIISVALIIHAYIERFTMIEGQLESKNTQFEVQTRQQKHEIEFAKLQAEMFKKETRSRAKPAEPTIS